MSRINSSTLWDYFDKTNTEDKKAKCRACGDSYSYKGTTGNLKVHLKKRYLDAYSRLMFGRQEISATLAVGSTTSAATTSTATISTSTTLTSTPTPSISTGTRQQTIERYGATKKNSAETKRKIDEDLMDLFIDSYQPFSLVEERSFKKFARWIPGYQLPTRKTVSNSLIPALYNRTKEELKDISWINIFEELTAEPQKFFNFVRMSTTDFEILLQKLAPYITKNDTPFRLTIPAKVRLAVALRYLATGDNFRSLHYLFKISYQLISEIVQEVCAAILIVFKDEVKSK